MATNYPGAIDTYTNPLSSEPMNAPSHAGQHANANDAIEAVQAELGTTPSGSESTVAARLTAIEDGTRLGANSVGATQIANDSVDTAAIQDDAVTADKIAADAVGSSEIAANAVGSSELADNAVDTAAIATGAVTAPKILIGAATVGSGTGTPEGVVTAAPGSTFLQTDSTTDVKGWIKWVKATGTGNTGWVAGPEADTGWRNISSLITAGAFGTLSAALLRRVGSQVFVHIRGNTTGGTLAGSTGGALFTIPAGFVPKTYGRYLVEFRSDVPVVYHNVSTLNILTMARATSVNLPSADFAPALAWSTPDAWPSSLPGSAA